MGQEVRSTTFSREDRQRYRERVMQDLDIFERMLEDRAFDFDVPMIGTEIEVNLVGQDRGPALVNGDVLPHLQDGDWQTELARFNIELNLAPQVMSGDVLSSVDQQIEEQLTQADRAAQSAGAEVATIGILPTVMPDIVDEDWVSQDRRYTALGNALVSERDGPASLELRGPGGEGISLQTESVCPISLCTSVQFHLQVEPREFPMIWNASQLIAGAQVALGANSPFAFGRRLWAETRIDLFSQGVDTRSEELRYQDVLQRAPFGRRWITSIFDLFEENVRCFPALLPELSDDDPLSDFEAGRAPALADLCLHNGTVWRWNRPIYDIVDGRPHLRIENRVLPSGPTTVDTVANAAFYYGLMMVLPRQPRPLWTRMSPRAAERNFYRAAEYGLGCRQRWPGKGMVPVTEVITERLLPRAAEGLRRLELDADVTEHYMDVLRGRCENRQNGASWQSKTVSSLERQGASRLEALQEMTGLYIQHSRENKPVHTWPLP